jgi:hypothetical protein
MPVPKYAYRVLTISRLNNGQNLLHTRTSNFETLEEATEYRARALTARIRSIGNIVAVETLVVLDSSSPQPDNHQAVLRVVEHR